MSPASLKAGDVFADRWQIVQCAGSGGMGVVYKATDLQNNVQVALKLLHTQGNQDEAERFLREANLLAQLKHPAIVSYVAHGQTPTGQLFLAMQWLEGEDLGKRLALGPLSVDESIVLAERIAGALAVAHQNGVVHRDIKPANIFLFEHKVEQSMLLDFGIARRIDAIQNVTQTGMIVGTPGYMSPEQARGRKDITPAADIFSLGCVLYKCLTNERPFDADHVAAILTRILFDEPEPLHEKRSDIPESFLKIIQRMLEKDPSRRWVNGQSLLDEIVQLKATPSLVNGPTLDIHSKKPLAFGEDEQLLVSVVLAAPPQTASDDAPTAAVTSIDLDSVEKKGLLENLMRLGTTADFLATGALLVTVPRLGSAQDQASIAAHAALIIKSQWPAAIVSVATGKGSLKGRLTVGEVVNRAAQAFGLVADTTEQSAVRSGVILDNLSGRLLESRFAQSKIGDILLLHEEKKLDASRPLLGKPTVCVGRDAELGNLETLYSTCVEEEEACAVIVTAPAGVGKSRLRHEFLRRIKNRSNQPRIITANVDLVQSNTPYAVIAQLILTYCSLSGHEDSHVFQQQLSQNLSASVSESDKERLVLFLGEIAGANFSSKEHPILAPGRDDPRIMRDQMRRAFIDWVKQLIASSPLMIIIDDLQWADEQSVSLLDDMLTELSNAPIFLLTLARPELFDKSPRLWSNHNAQRIALSGLGKKACIRLIQQALGDSLSQPIMNRLIEQAGGNALFLEELVRACASGFSFAQSDTIQAMLQARIGRFEVGPRRALLAASIFGQHFTYAGVQAVLEITTAPQSTLTQWLQMLINAEMIVLENQTAQEMNYVFRHALIQDAARSLLTPEDLVIGHRLAGQFLAENNAAPAEVIAEHFERGDALTRAAEYYAHAAAHSLYALSYNETHRWVEKGIHCGAQGQVLGALHGCSCLAHFFGGRIDLLFETAQKALPLLRHGSRAWVRTIFGAFAGCQFGPPEWLAQFPAIVGQLLSATPEPDALNVYAEALAWVITLMIHSVPRSHIMPVWDRLKSVCKQVMPSDPAVSRYAMFAQLHINWHFGSTPYSTLQLIMQTIEECAKVRDLRTLRICHVFAECGSWRELGAPEQGLQRMTLLQDQFTEEDTIAHLAFLLEKAYMQWVLNPEENWRNTLEVALQMCEQAWMVPPVCARAHELVSRIAIMQSDPQRAESHATLAQVVLERIPHAVPTVHEMTMRALLLQNKVSQALEEAEKTQKALAYYGSFGWAEVDVRSVLCEVYFAANEIEKAREELKAAVNQVKIRKDDITDPQLRHSYLTKNESVLRLKNLCQKHQCLAWSL